MGECFFTEMNRRLHVIGSPTSIVRKRGQGGKGVRNLFLAVHAFSGVFFGRRRGRRVDSRPRRAAIRATQVGSPDGRPRAMHNASASCSSAASGWFTHVSQLAGQPWGGSGSRPRPRPAMRARRGRTRPNFSPDHDHAESLPSPQARVNRQPPRPESPGMVVRRDVPRRCLPRGYCRARTGTGKIIGRKDLTFAESVSIMFGCAGRDDGGRMVGSGHEPLTGCDGDGEVMRRCFARTWPAFGGGAEPPEKNLARHGFLCPKRPSKCPYI
jgi:hypothetical protein